jgi:hypothetical protein
MKTTARLASLVPLLLAGVAAVAASTTWGPKIAEAHGAKAFGSDRVRYLRFDFVVRKDGEEKARFRHLLDRSTGDYRYEADAAKFANVPFFDEETRSWRPIGLKLPAGRLVAIGNRWSDTGRVWIDGKEQARSLATRVRQRVDNDSWWLVLPLELGASGLRMKSGGEVELEGGGKAHRLTLTFASDAGDTPGDVYRLFVDPGTHRMIRTEIDLQNRDVTVRARWKDEVVLRGVTFYRRRILPDRTLALEDLALPSTVPEGVFRDPATGLTD